MRRDGSWMPTLFLWTVTWLLYTLAASHCEIHCPTKDELFNLNDWENISPSSPHFFQWLHWIGGPALIAARAYSREDCTSLLHVHARTHTHTTIITPPLVASPSLSVSARLSSVLPACQKGALVLEARLPSSRTPYESLPPQLPPSYPKARAPLSRL